MGFLTIFGSIFVLIHLTSSQSISGCCNTDFNVCGSRLRQACGEVAPFQDNALYNCRGTDQPELVGLCMFGCQYGFESHDFCPTSSPAVSKSRSEVLSGPNYHSRRRNVRQTGSPVKIDYGSITTDSRVFDAVMKQYYTRLLDTNVLTEEKAAEIGQALHRELLASSNITNPVGNVETTPQPVNLFQGQKTRFQMGPGTSLSGQEKILSRNETASLVMQRDGNLVIYRTCDDTPIWASATEMRSAKPDVLELENDGTLSLYKTFPRRRLIWRLENDRSASGGSLTVQDDGDLCWLTAGGLCGKYALGTVFRGAGLTTCG